MPFYAIYLKQKKKGQQNYGPSLQILCEFSPIKCTYLNTSCNKLF